MKELKVTNEVNINFGLCRELSVVADITYMNCCGARYSKGCILDISLPWNEASDEEKEEISQMTKNDNWHYYQVHISSNVGCCGTLVFDEKGFKKDWTNKTFTLNDVLSYVSADADCSPEESKPFPIDVSIMINKVTLFDDNTSYYEPTVMTVSVKQPLIGSKEVLQDHIDKAEKEVGLHD